MPGQIPKFKRTKKFVEQDYDLVRAFFNVFTLKVTTPNILTEISNLAGDIAPGLRKRFFRSLQTSFELLNEQYVPSQIGASSPIFPQIGLTDSIIAQVAMQRYLVVTDDFVLFNYLGSIEADVINFNHLREFDTPD
jgi:predicted nucleic acid-binding protein